jgi:tyrosine-protein kinase Etk/Wzc
MLITELVARPGTQFEVKHWNMLDAVKNFSDVLKIADKVKDTGLVEITYTDRFEEKAAEVANAVSRQYIATAVATRQRTDSATLAFITKELPRLRSELARAEQALSDYQTSSQSMQPSNEAQAYLQGAIDFDRRIAELQIQRTQLLERYAPDSRWVASIDTQLKQLDAAKKAFDARFASMPVSERRNVDLTRDAKVAETIYLGMMQKAEELSVRRASTTGGAHIVDDAVVPFRAVKPDRLLILSGAAVLGLICGASFVFVRRHVMTGVTDPRFVEEHVGIPLIGEVLLSARQVTIDREMGLRTGRLVVPRQGVSNVLANRYPDDPAIEALRGVRTALALDLAHAPNPIVMLAAPTSAAGKSFVAINLAVLHAEVGMRVLLVDADMRGGELAYFFGRTNQGGLSEVLSGEMEASAAVCQSDVEGLSFVPCGSRTQNPAALLMKPSFKALMRRFSDEFDLVIVDTPPVLCVTDASIVASDAGATVLVLRSGLQSEVEIADAVKKLDRSQARIAGAVFNAIAPRRGSRRYGSGYGYPSRRGKAMALESAM